MNGPDTRPEDEDWSELADLWVTPNAEPDLAPKALRRRALLARLHFHGEAWGALVAGAYGVYVAVRENLPEIGFASAAFTGFAFLISLWSRRGTMVPLSGTPRDALEAALRQGKSGQRWARGGQACCLAAIAFLWAVHLYDRPLPAQTWWFTGLILLLAAAAYEYHARRARKRIQRYRAALNDLDAL